MPPALVSVNAKTTTKVSDSNVANIENPNITTCAASYCRFVVDFALPALFRFLTEHPTATRSKFDTVCDQLFGIPLSDSEIKILQQESEKLFSQLAREQSGECRTADDVAKRIMYRTYVVDYAIPAVIQLLRTNPHTTKEAMTVIQERLLSLRMLSPPEITVLLLQFENLYRTMSAQPPQQFNCEKDVDRVNPNTSSPKRVPSGVLTNSLPAKFQENRNQSANGLASRKLVHTDGNAAQHTMAEEDGASTDPSAQEVTAETPQSPTQGTDVVDSKTSTRSSKAEFYRTFVVDYALPAVVQLLRDRPSTTRAELSLLEKQLLKDPLTSTEIQILHSECDSVYASIKRTPDPSESSDTDSRSSNPPQPHPPSRTLSMPHHLQSTGSKPIPLLRSSTAPAVLPDPVRDEVHAIVQEACKSRVDGSYHCPRCDRAFSRRFNLRIHVASTHCNVKEFLCEKCGKAFARRHDMRRHCKYIHEGGDVFKYKLGQEGSGDGGASEQTVGTGVGGALEKPMGTGGWSIRYTGGR
ncbi:hypothetical protein BJ742DRAFT_792339 [Cladochytrium replicatum]|nr:hypothetical protein BJ742DRAFT_792339 [Cladochytrium replicatum]